MFVRVKDTGRYRYLQLVRNHREGSRSVQRVLCTLGRLEELQEQGRIDVLVRSLARFRKPPEPSDLNGPCRPRSGRAGKLKPDYSSGTIPQPTARITSPPLRPGPSTITEPRDPSEANDLEPLTFSEIHKSAEVLGKSPMFSDLDKAHLLELSRFARQRHLKAREFLFFAGDTLECCYLIASGRIKLLKHSFSGKDFITGAYGAGEMLSTTLLFTGKTHPSSAQAMIDSKVLVIKNDSFVSFLHRFPELGIGIVAKILDAVGGRHQAATVQLSELAAERAEYRLARVLSTLSLKFGSSIPFSRHEIGEMAGTSTETAARFVARLSRGGVVRSTRGRIVVMHPNKLRLLAEAQLSA